MTDDIDRSRMIGVAMVVAIVAIVILVAISSRSPHRTPPAAAAAKQASAPQADPAPVVAPKLKAVEIPKLRKPPPIMVPERKAKKRQAERTDRPKRASYCEVLRARMAKTPTRVFSCAEMKAARRCERPGDRGMATAAQLAEGARCWASGEL